MGTYAIEDFLGEVMDPKILNTHKQSAVVIKTIDLTELSSREKKGVLVHYVYSNHGIVAQGIDEDFPDKPKPHWTLRGIKNGHLKKVRGFTAFANQVGIKPIVLSRLIVSQAPRLKRRK